MTRAPFCRQNEALQEKRSEKSVFRGRCALTPRFAATVLFIAIIIISIFLFFLSMEAPRQEPCAPHPPSVPPLPFPLISRQTRSSEASLPALERPGSAHPGPNPRYSPGSSRSQPARQPKGGKSALSRWDAGLARSPSETKSATKALERGGLSPAALIPLWGCSGGSGSGCVQCRGEEKKKLRKIIIIIFPSRPHPVPSGGPLQFHLVSSSFPCK